MFFMFFAVQALNGPTKTINHRSTNHQSLGGSGGIREALTIYAENSDLELIPSARSQSHVPSGVLRGYSGGTPGVLRGYSGGTPGVLRGYSGGTFGVHWGYFRGTALPLLSIRLYVYMSIRLRGWEPEPRRGIARLIGKIDLELKCMLRIQT